MSRIELLGLIEIINLFFVFQKKKKKINRQMETRVGFKILFASLSFFFLDFQMTACVFFSLLWLLFFLVLVSDCCWFFYRELDEELQDSLYEFLEDRGIDDEMAVFLHEYVKNKDRNEFIRWMGTVKTYIESK